MPHFATKLKKTIHIMLKIDIILTEGKLHKFDCQHKRMQKN